MKMKPKNTHLQFIYIILFAISLVTGKYVYEIKHFDVPLDHFGYAVDHTFKIRYLINNTYATENDSPILFYTGNEGDIELFAQNTGFMWEIAPKLKALLVFAEHRYYGKSFPFNNSFESPTQFGYLTSEQALADYADLLKHLDPDSSRPVIAIGGSYGGMLAAWFRMKYPHLVEGALASSAPILQFQGITPCGIFSRITTSVYSISNPNCSANIQKSWKTMQDMLAKEEDKHFLNEKFKFCKNVTNTDDLNKFFDYLVDVYGNLAMINYPYETNFLAPVPAYPVREFCSKLAKNYEGKELITALQAAVSVYSNYSNQSPCLNYTTANGAMGDDAWDIQTCNEMVMPMCSNGTDDMFLKSDWNLTEFEKKCFQKYKLKPRVNSITTTYGGKKLSYASNIIFSNGLLDPWAGGGVIGSTNPQIQILIIPGAAHHLDLRASNTYDPEAVRKARTIELNTISSWIRNYRLRS